LDARLPRRSTGKQRSPQVSRIQPGSIESFTAVTRKELIARSLNGVSDFQFCQAFRLGGGKGCWQEWLDRIALGLAQLMIAVFVGRTPTECDGDRHRRKGG
jgi:hypothetical protein